MQNEDANELLLMPTNPPLIPRQHLLYLCDHIDAFCSFITQWVANEASPLQEDEANSRKKIVDFYAEQIPRVISFCLLHLPDGGILKDALETVSAHLPEIATLATKEWASTLADAGNALLAAVNTFPRQSALLEALEFGLPDSVHLGAVPICLPPAQKIEVPAQPKQWLTSWKQICLELASTGYTVTKEQVQALHARFPGPIKVGSQGSWPLVDRVQLLLWWNEIDRHYEEAVKIAEDRKATVQGKHPYGSSGTVIPEIKGATKDRRRKR